MKKQKQQTEVFKRFISIKESEVSEAVCLLDESADKLDLMESLLMIWDEDQMVFDQSMATGLGHILGDIGHDIRLISANIMAGVDEKTKKAKAALKI